MKLNDISLCKRGRVCKGNMMSMRGRGVMENWTNLDKGGMGSKIPEILRTSYVHCP